MTVQYPGESYYYNRSSPFNNDNVKRIQAQLSASNYLKKKYVDGYFGEETEKALKKYQKDNNLTVTGVVNQKTWEILFANVDTDNLNTTSNLDKDNTQSNTNNAIVGDSNRIRFGSNNVLSFFNEKNTDTMRKNNNDIVITYGNGAKCKVIKNVILRSKTQVINAGGQPIADQYEFIGRDLIEKDF